MLGQGKSGACNMGYSLRIQLLRGTLKIKSKSRLRSHERDGKSPTFRLFSTYFVWEPRLEYPINVEQAAAERPLALDRELEASQAEPAPSSGDATLIEAHRDGRVADVAVFEQPAMAREERELRSEIDVLRRGRAELAASIPQRGKAHKDALGEVDQRAQEIMADSVDVAGALAELAELQDLVARRHIFASGAETRSVCTSEGGDRGAEAPEGDRMGHSVVSTKGSDAPILLKKSKNRQR